MPDTCVIDLGLNGENPDAAGIPTVLRPYARVEGACAAVRFNIRASDGGQVLFSGVAPTDSNGTASTVFFVEPPVFPCGHTLYVEAECIDGGTCSAGRPLAIACKGSRPPRNGEPGGGAPGDGTPGGGGEGGGAEWPGWPWPLPPALFCPLIGRSFTTAVLFGLITIVASVALGFVPGVGVGLAVIAAAFAVLVIWRQWCTPHRCYVWGAILWALKRAAAVGLVLSAFVMSVAGVLVSLAFCMAAGILTGRLRYDRCQLPALTTPMSQLPMW